MSLHRDIASCLPRHFERDLSDVLGRSPNHPLIRAQVKALQLTGHGSMPCSLGAYHPFSIPLRIDGRMQGPEGLALPLLL